MVGRGPLQSIMYIKINGGIGGLIFFSSYLCFPELNKQNFRWVERLKVTIKKLQHVYESFTYSLNL